MKYCVSNHFILPPLYCSSEAESYFFVLTTFLEVEFSFYASSEKEFSAVFLTDPNCELFVSSVVFYVGG